MRPNQEERLSSGRRRGGVGRARAAPAARQRPFGSGPPTQRARRVGGDVSPDAGPAGRRRSRRGRRGTERPRAYPGRHGGVRRRGRHPRPGPSSPSAPRPRRRGPWSETGRSRACRRARPPRGRTAPTTTIGVTTPSPVKDIPALSTAEPLPRQWLPRRGGSRSMLLPGHLPGMGGSASGNGPNGSWPGACALLMVSPERSGGWCSAGSTRRTT